MIESWLAAKAGLIGVWFVALAAAERLAPSAPRPPGERRIARNLGLWAGNALMNPLLIVPIAAAAATFEVWRRPDAPAWVWLCIDLVALDLWAYGWHRANHEWRWLWRFHRVHHLDRFLDVTSAVRFHPGEVLISALARAPLLALADIALVSVVVFDVLMLAAALFHHSNLRLPRRLESVLRLVVVTPSHHWVHHHVRSEDTNSNYGAVLTLWDRLFGSWSATQRTPAMPIGLEAEPDRPLPALAAAPFAHAPGQAPAGSG